MSILLQTERAPRSPFRRLAAGGGLAFLARNRYQILGALIIAVLVPTLLRTELEFLAISRWRSDNTVIGTAVAIIAGALIFRRMQLYPGAQSAAYVFPVFAASYVLVIVGFFFLRLDYSRAQFLLSFALTVLWYLAVFRIERRVHRPRYLLLPFGAAPGLAALSGAEWLAAQSPDRPPTGVSAVVADLRADMPDDWERMLANAMLNGVPVYHTKQLSESITGRVELEHLSENIFGALLPSSLHLRFQRIGDIFLVLLTLPVTVPLIGLAALAIRLFDGGDVLFRQERMGYRGRTFTMLKLRTMSPDPAGSRFTEDRDPRITKVGRCLRRCRIDELPQIVNILRGQMSWIGPRPEAIELSHWYESQIPFYRYRHIVRPGISGWGAVNQGNVGAVEAATYKLQYDFYYIKYFSLWLDILIMAKTVRTVLTGFGSK